MAGRRLLVHSPFLLLLPIVVAGLGIGVAGAVGLWIMPPGYGGGKADAVRIDVERCPTAKRKEVAAWNSAYPQSTAFVKCLNRELR